MPNSTFLYPSTCITETHPTIQNTCPKSKLVESRNIDIRDSVNYKEVIKHFGLGPNGAIMILGLPVLCFLFFGSPVRWKMVLCRLVLCRLCGLDSMLIHQNLERLAMKFQNNNGNPNDHVS